MEWKEVFLAAALLAALVGILALSAKLIRVKGQLRLIRDALQDMRAGNQNRRLLARENDMTREICYGINEIAQKSQQQLIRQQQSEQAYKRLMTSLSHDVKTPLASLTGYLEAIQEGLVKGEEKEEYLRVALRKADRLKEFVEALFEWVKLDSGEQSFHFERQDVNELTRDILAGWIPVLEKEGWAYEIDVPEEECFVNLDDNAYLRILNNLIQNARKHSGGSRLWISLNEEETEVRIRVSDNGRGIPKEELPHIFERMYQGDRSRSHGGNGLGLSIARELILAHGGRIRAESREGEGSSFFLELPKAL